MNDLPPSGPDCIEWLRTALRTVGDAIITTNSVNEITFMNSTAASLTGTKSDGLGRPLDSVFRGADSASSSSIDELVDRALTAQHGVDGRVEVLFGDDTTAVAYRFDAMRGQDGAVLGFVLSFREEEVRHQHAGDGVPALDTPERVLATSLQPVVVLDDELRIVAANLAFRNTVSEERGEITGRELFDLSIDAWDTAAIRSALEGATRDDPATREPGVDDDFVRVGSLLLNLTGFRAAAGARRMVVVTAVDLLDRRLTEEALRVSELRYRRLFESAYDGILIIDASTGLVIDANPYICKLLDYELDELMGKQLWEIGLFSDKHENMEVFDKLQTRGYVRYDHLPLKSKNGNPVDVEFVSNSYEVDGKIVAQCNIRDITERRRLEQRTESQAVMLSDLHRRKDEFLAMLSHELRNPLAPIANAVQILRLESASEELRRNARDIIGRQVSQLTRLVNDLTEVSRLTTGKLELKLELISVSDVVANAVESAKPLIDQRKHELTISWPKTLVWMTADAARLEQVIVNLLTNAAKYTEMEGRIDVSVYASESECVIRVSDSGSGIPPDLQPKIFDLFTQSKRSLDRSQGGLGIGLALVRQIVELHGGHVSIRSIENEGTEFAVHLPIQTLPSEHETTRAVDTPHPIGSPMRVLVVDDNVDAAESLATLVRSLGHEVVTAYSGLVAVDAVSGFAPHAVLLDLGLPELDGYQVAVRIRGMQGHRSTMIASVSGYGQNVDREASVRSGIDHHLVKPVDFKRLREILASIET